MEEIKENPEKSPAVYGEVCIRRKQRRKRQKLLIIELLYDYAKNSTLHGLRYIVERGLHYIERFFWLLTFILSIIMCSCLIFNVWIKWKTSPVIVSLSESVVPVGNVPFPSITICPQLKCKANIFNFSDEFQNYMEAKLSNNLEKQWKNFTKLEDISKACGRYLDVFTYRNVTNSSLVDHLIEVAPTVRDAFFLCHWRDKYVNCSEIFRTVLTYEGVCYNFNALAETEIFREENLQKDYKYLDTDMVSKDWSIENGYTGYSEHETFPRRGRENNEMPDLNVILQEAPEQRDELCNSFKSGYTIYVQHPADLPQSSLYYYAALPGQVSSLALKFDMVTTDYRLVNYDPEIRKCFFTNERQLRYFRIYTSNNCRLECQSNYTFAHCQCVWFHMPHNDSRTICAGEEQETCMKNALNTLSMSEIVTQDKTEGATQPCRCLPSCNSIHYDAEILKTQFNLKPFFRAMGKLAKRNMSSIYSKRFSQIEVYFKEPHFTSMRRSELFGITDFLANCGGLLGLFLGFSFLSLVEIFYFGTIRLFYVLQREDLKQEKRNN